VKETDEVKTLSLAGDATLIDQAARARTWLRRLLWLSEVSIITIAAVTAVQIATEHGGSPWACGPVAIIAAMETMRVPLAGWAAHLRPLAKIGAFVVMAAISVLTFEGMSIAVERFMHQRVVDVAEAREAVDAIKLKVDAYKAETDGLTTEICKRRALVAELQGKQPATVNVPPAATCRGLYKGRPITYACPNKAAEVAAQASADAQQAHAHEVADAQKSLTDAEAQLKALQKPDDAGLADAQKALQKAAAGSTMYRTAAAWFGTPVKDLTAEQFERFKRIAVYGVAGAAATATMLVSFISHAVPHEQHEPSKLIRGVRAYIARKRRRVSLVKTVEVPKEIVKTITKHIHIPVDINTWRVVNRDGSLGDEVPPLHVVQGGKS
jgi:hypothetical protein